MVEDHQTEHSLASQHHRDVPVEAVAPAQQYYVWVTLSYVHIKYHSSERKIHLIEMFHKLLLVLEIVCDIGDFKFQIAQLITKFDSASFLFIEVVNVLGRKSLFLPRRQ